MIVLEYSIIFEKLSCYAPHLIPTEDEKIDRFAHELISGIRKDTGSGRRNTTFTNFVDLVMDLERIHQEERANREQNKKARTFGTFSAVPNSGKRQSSRWSSGPPQSRMQTASSSPPLAYNTGHGGQFRPVQSDHRTTQQALSSVGSRQCQSSATRGPRSPCYGCGLMGHIRKFCPNGQHGLIAHLSPSMATTSVAPPPPRGNGGHSGRNAGNVPQTTTSSQGTHPRFYTMPTRPIAEASDVVVTCILTVCTLDAYALMDPESIFSYVTPYFALDFGIVPEQLLEPFSMSTSMGDFVIASHIYRGCCYAILDCRAKVAKFEFPNESVREWKGNITEPRGKFISYLKAKNMITKGYLYHLVRVTDTTAEVTSIQYVPVVNEFLDVFPDELPGIPPDRVIDFGIDLVPDTQPISIPLY
ncbi:uncharacterized protein LOC142167138 [Nicotiana tabacum]|uniref:Uncharacterized protein LOC142167138 n=1 Tax=Nicotiana tabacum TaxID=4097 RepID=A0AC58SEJ0_TOBAC